MSRYWISGLVFMPLFGTAVLVSGCNSAPAADKEISATRNAMTLDANANRSAGCIANESLAACDAPGSDDREAARTMPPGRVAAIDRTWSWTNRARTGG